MTDNLYMAIDQYGNHYHGLKNPRKDLIEKIGVKHISKMYVDSNDGEVYQTGYVVGQYWCSVYKIIPMMKKQG